MRRWTFPRFRRDQRASLGTVGSPELSARIGRIGADPRDDEDLRNKKALLVLLAVLILPVSLVWGSSYLAFGSLLGILPFIYFSISVASLVFFAKTKRFMPFLIVQLLDVMLMTALGMMLSGGFLPSGGVGAVGLPRAARSPGLPRGAPGDRLVHRVRR